MNVVLVIVDSLRKDHVGAYGMERAVRTPSLDALAGESLRFTRAYPESIPSIPARRSIHTGTRTWPFRGWELSNVNEDDVALWGWEPIPEEQTTLAEILVGEGYRTMFVTDTLHQFRADYNFHRGFQAFEFIRGQERDLYMPLSPASQEKIEGVLIGGPKASHAEEIMRQYFANTLGREREEDWFSPRVFSKGMEFLRAARDAGPFFLVVDNYDPHEPWDTPDEYISLYSDGYEDPEPMIPSSGPSDWMTEPQIERMRARYSAEVTMMDRWLGRFLDEMNGLGLMEDTLLVFVSDHGHAFGEHGFVGKVSAAMYPELTDITFMIRDPNGRGAGEASDFFASTHDVASTILSALGIERPEAMGGQNLGALLDGGEPEEPRPHFTSGYHDHVWTRDGRYAMFARNDGSDARLFDLEADPNMDRDIAPANRDVVRRMWEGYVLEDAGGPLP